MKKIFAALLTLIMVATLCACTSDHTLKFNGIWSDNLNTSVLELMEDGTANLRLEDNLYKFYWTTKDYDTIVLSVEIEEGDLPMFVPEFSNATIPEDETTEEEVPEAEGEILDTENELVAPATEEPVVEDVVDTEEDAESTEPAPFNKKKYKLPVFEMTLSIRKGVMYLVIEEIEEANIYYNDFNFLMEGVVLNNPAQEYFPELSKVLKSIAFTKDC